MKTNIPAYQTCMSFVIEMFKKDVIDEDDYKEMEQFLADRFGIKDKSIYRLNNLLCTQERVMNICEGGMSKDDRNDQDRAEKEVDEIT